MPRDFVERFVNVSCPRKVNTKRILEADARAIHKCASVRGFMLSAMLSRSAICLVMDELPNRLALTLTPNLKQKRVKTAKEKPV